MGSVISSHMLYAWSKQKLTTVLTSTWLNGSIYLLPHPFAHQTNVTSTEKSISIAMVAPMLKELKLHIKKVCTYYIITTNNSAMYPLKMLNIGKHARLNSDKQE